MKKLNTIAAVAVLTLLVPLASSAGDLLCEILHTCDSTPPPVPEPSGALIMGAALLTLAVVRKARK